jgi:AcrR family transcriptional regulator
VATSTKENLIQAGLDLFHRHGIHLVGLDRILQKAGVTKTTFYNHFESKETFSCEVIDRFGQELQSRISRVDASHEVDTKQHLLAVFDAWDQLSSGKAFRGCLLVGAGVASGDRNDPARQAAIRNKRKLLDVYRNLASSAGIKNAERFATRFGLLVDGAIIARHLYDDRDEAEEARKMAERMIDSELAKVRKSNA